jgi:hypothetical protein
MAPILHEHWLVTLSAWPNLTCTSYPGRANLHCLPWDFVDYP